MKSQCQIRCQSDRVESASEELVQDSCRTLKQYKPIVHDQYDVVQCTSHAFHFLSTGCQDSILDKTVEKNIYKNI